MKLALTSALFTAALAYLAFKLWAALRSRRAQGTTRHAAGSAHRRD